MTSTVFFSYSHDDEIYRDQLEKHLALLRHQGLIETWHDRRIVAGSEIDPVIDQAIEKADVILLLISSSFLSSTYCYSRELKRALERHSEGSAAVIPVILRPCDWHSAPFGKLMAVPTDGKAITQWPNLDESFSIVAKEVRKVVEGRVTNSTQISPRGTTPIRRAEPALPRSSNLRLRKEFSDLDADTFLREAFDFMAKFFEGSLDELQRRNPQIDGRFERVDARAFVAAVYKNGKKQSQCSVYVGTGGFGGNGISYSSDPAARGNSFNERLSVKADDQSLYLQPIGMMFGQRDNRDQMLTAEGASELFWSMLIGRLQ
jgi:hypothetical protein